LPINSLFHLDGPLNPELVQSFKNLVERSSSVLIGSHLNPDGDALGSSLAMSHYLTGMGIQNEVVNHHPAPRNLQFLPGINKVRQAPVGEKFELGIVLDLDSLDRLGNAEPYFAMCDRLIVIDHHVPHEAPGDLRIVDTSSPATAILVARLFEALGVEMTPAIATCLFTGIVTDTGSFRFRNTTPEALQVGARLLEQGADLNLVSEEVFQSKTVASARLLGLALETMHMESHDRIAWAAIYNHDFMRFEAKDEDTEGFVNELLSIESVQIAVLAREPKIGKIRVSLRSRGDLDVAAVAREFGGGGHKNAAGCTFETDMETAVSQLIHGLNVCLGPG
jgi:phosphoesterase RecJ-like protein